MVENISNHHYNDTRHYQLAWSHECLNSQFTVLGTRQVWALSKLNVNKQLLNLGPTLKFFSMVRSKIVAPYKWTNWFPYESEPDGTYTNFAGNLRGPLEIWPGNWQANAGQGKIWRRDITKSTAVSFKRIRLPRWFSTRIARLTFPDELLKVKFKVRRTWEKRTGMLTRKEERNSNVNVTLFGKTLWNKETPL
jgi:hypothetical protein